VDTTNVTADMHFDWGYYLRVTEEVKQRLAGTEPAAWSEDWRDAAFTALGQFRDLVAVGAYELTPDIEQLRREVDAFTAQPARFTDYRYTDRFWRHWVMFMNRAEYWYTVFRSDLE